MPSDLSVYPQRTLRLVLVTSPETELAPLPKLISFGTGFCARLHITHLQMSAAMTPLDLPPELQPPVNYDLVIDLRPPPAPAPDLVQFVAPASLLAGAGARAVYELLTQLQVFCQEMEIQSGIIDSATDAIITINEDHRIVAYNRGAEKIFGFTREEALGQDLTILIPPPHKDKHRDYVRRYLATRTAHVIGKHVQLSAQRQDGSEFPMSISFSVAEVGDNLYFTGIVRDISEYVALEDQLRESERLATVGNIVSHIAHEIKNPLMIIGGFARQLAKADRLDDKGRQKLNIITEEVERLESLMSDMRDFSRPPDLKKHPGHIDQLLRDVEALYTDTLKDHHIDLRLELPDSLPPCVFDPQQLKQVLVNLIKNASEAMPRGGAITLAARLANPFFEIEVTDTGEGIPPELVANIFTPYFTTKSKGSGLGLAISHNIIKAHKGEIKVSSTVGQGSTFLIQIPLEEIVAGQCLL